MREKKLRILIVSDTPWDDSNSFGSTFSNIFGGNPGYEIASIYLQPGLPSTQVCSRFFQISEKSILRSMFHRGPSSGCEVRNVPNAVNSNGSLAKRVKRIRWQVFFWMRDLIWATGRWKSEALNRFIDDFRPDIVFQPVYFQSYIDRVGMYARDRTGVPMVGYISDDNYTLKRFSLSPLFWIDRLIKRRYVKRVIDRCEILYTITDKQRDEYNELFGNKCKVLYKGGDFAGEQPAYTPNRPLQFLYTGNLGAGRWETLADIIDCLHRIDRQGEKFRLDIYSQTPLSPKALRRLNVEGTSSFRGSIPASKVRDVQRSADVLIHVESFQLSERYKARLSFSTKIVDYMQTGRCILAVGWEQTGGIEYLRKFDAAMVVTDNESLLASIELLVNDPNVRLRYATNAYRCGVENHRFERIRTGLYRDLCRVASRSFPET